MVPGKLVAITWHQIRLLVAAISAVEQGGSAKRRAGTVALRVRPASAVRTGRADRCRFVRHPRHCGIVRRVTSAAVQPKAQRLLLQDLAAADVGYCIGPGDNERSAFIRRTVGRIGHWVVFQPDRVGIKMIGLKGVVVVVRSALL